LRYKKQPTKSNQQGQDVESLVLGMLYLVNVHMVNRSTGEKIKHRILMIGSEISDIERKCRWAFDIKKYVQFSISGVEKVRDKMHVLNTSITQQSEKTGPVIEVGDRTIVVNQGVPDQCDELKVFAIGVATSMLATSEDHALRKVGIALRRMGADGPKAKTGPFLSEDSVVTVSEMGKSSGHAHARDVSAEVNKAHFVRG